MKRIKYFMFLLGFAAALGCERRKDAATELTEPEFGGNTVEETATTDEEVKRRPSHVDFQQAVTLYSRKEYDRAADFMRQGNASLKGELSQTEGDLKREAQDLVSDITLLVGQVRQGEVQSIQNLQAPLGKAQRLVAQQYFEAVQDNAAQQPSEMMYQVDLGLQALENSFQYGNQTARADVQPLITETRQMLQNQQAINREQLTAQVNKLINWLEGQR